MKRINENCINESLKCLSDIIEYLLEWRKKLSLTKESFSKFKTKDLNV